MADGQAKKRGGWQRPERDGKRCAAAVCRWRRACDGLSGYCDARSKCAAPEADCPSVSNIRYDPQVVSSSKSPAWRLLCALVVVVLALVATAPSGTAGSIHGWTPTARWCCRTCRKAQSRHPRATCQPPRAFTTRAVSNPRSRSYDDLIETHASRNGVRTDLVRAVIQVESAFNARAVSNKGRDGADPPVDAGHCPPGGMPTPSIRRKTCAAASPICVNFSTNYAATGVWRSRQNPAPATSTSSGRPCRPSETRDYVARIPGIAGTRTTPPAQPRINVLGYRIDTHLQGRRGDPMDVKWCATPIRRHSRGDDAGSGGKSGWSGGTGGRVRSGRLIGKVAWRSFGRSLPPPFSRAKRTRVQSGRRSSAHHVQRS